MVIIDTDLLSASKQFVVNTNEEVRVDLFLKRKQCEPKTTVTGQVTTYSTPVKQATVKILDKKYNPITHAITNDNGNYCFKNVLPGDYKITATAPGFLVAPAIDFSIKKNETKKINIRIQSNTSTKKGFVYGIVTDQKTENRIEGVLITLFIDSSNIPLTQTVTNAYGQYLFCNIPPGNYYIKTYKRHYYNNPANYFKICTGGFINVNIKMNHKPSNEDGMMSSITKNGCKMFKDVCLGQYKNKENNKILVQKKTTHKEEFYLLITIYLLILLFFNIFSNQS